MMAPAWHVIQISLFGESGFPLCLESSAVNQPKLLECETPWVGGGTPHMIKLNVLIQPCFCVIRKFMHMYWPTLFRIHIFH